LLSPLAFAQEQTLSLAWAIKKTLQHNPSLNVFKFRQTSLEGQRKTAALRPRYVVGFDSENFAGTGDYQGIKSSELTLSLSSIIEMGDKQGARLNLVQQRSVFINAQQKIASLNLLGEVTRRYINVLAAQSRVSLSAQAIALAQDTLDEVTKRSRAGVAPTAEIKRAMAAVGNARLVSSNEQGQLDYARRALVMMWNEKTPKFTSVEGSLFRFAHALPFEQLINQIEQNPAVMAFASEQRVKQAQLRLARSQSQRDVQWSVGMKHSRSNNDFAFNAGFSVPLFTNKRNTGQIMTAQAEFDEVAANRDITLLALRNQLFSAYSSRQQAIFTVVSLKDSIIPTLTQALSETQSAYQRGRYSYLDYLTAQQELLIARRALIDAGASALHYGAEIEELIAQPLPASQYNHSNESQGVTDEQ